MVNILRLRKLSVTIALMLVSLSTFAYDFEVDGIYYNKLSENTVEVTYEKYENWKYVSDYTGTIIIPSSITVDGIKYNVTSIGVSAFYGCSGLASITIPDGVTSIGNYAFHYCSGLASITIPDGVTSIGNYAFYYCSGLASITIPDGVTSIGEYAFYGCSGLTSINIPDGVTSIGEFAFSGCSGLTSINIPDGVTSIGNGAFYDCSGLTSIIIPDGVTSIGDVTFCGCRGLTSIIIPDGVTSIGDHAFSTCIGLTSINIPDRVTSIGNGAFYDCSGLTSIIIPDGVTSIRRETFSGCSSLTSIAIPDGVTSIGLYAFHGSGLTSIKIPDGITYIGYYAFKGCSGLTSINIPEGITSIGEYAFYYCSNLKEVNISNIENWMKINWDGAAFSTNYSLIVNGLKLTDLVVPESITTIGKYTFYNCKSLESITLHKDVSVIVQNAFNGCSNVKKIVCQGDTPPTCGAKALDGISRTECTLYVPETSGSNYKNTAPWSEFTNIVGGGTDTPDTPSTCEAPTITFDNDAKKLVFTSATQGATYVYTVTSEDMASEAKSTGEAAMTGVYTITAYASADGMYNSEKVTAKLCWVSASTDTDGILKAKADRGVIVSSNGNQININGTVNGETIEVYNVGGSKVKSVKANGDNTTISGLQTGSVYIVKIGGTKVKVSI